MVFYFTATGNSLYVAKKFDKNPVSVSQIIRQDELYFEDDVIGIVCPVYGHFPPRIVQEFLKKSRFKTDYFYIILTYGNRHGGAAEITAQFVEECGIRADYIRTILMVDNFLPVFDMDEQKLIDKKEDEQIAVALSDVAARKKEIPPATDEDRQAHQNLVERNAKSPRNTNVEMYKVLDCCSGCGVCLKVCPEGSYTLENGNAIRTGTQCQMCMACIHNCPRKAIQLGFPEKNPNARYRHKNITLKEIEEANNQSQQNQT